ncbi:MAG: YceI family protein [Thiohalomonadaceae bacterium]
MKKLVFPLLLLSLTAFSPAQAADYVLDTKGAHAFIQFRIKHLGYSWLYGRFNDFDGKFSYDEAKPDASTVEINIRTTSIDSNHAERDKHLRDKDFLNVRKFPTAKFVSTAFTEQGNGKALLRGKLTLHGVTKEIDIDVEHIGAGPDPWGGERRGFFGTTTLVLKDFGIDFDLGPASREVYLDLSVEGIKQ